jgi:hypothetical protein
LQRVGSLLRAFFSKSLLVGSQDTLVINFIGNTTGHCQKTDDRKQRTENRGQKTEDGKQRTDSDF